MSDKDDKAQDAIASRKTIAPGETFDENFGADELSTPGAPRLVESDDERAERIASYDPRGKFPFGLSELQDDEREFLKRVGWARSSGARPIGMTGRSRTGTPLRRKVMAKVPNAPER